ncbi:hypothetical protein Clopa_4668 [Clostridium pasteurianum BC1]|uniref:Uncharacterized protein n=1 Tax=Clostridium pasteurianum BC1 TaxID=86416 RepID=R4K850_CLOPA|nr:hypothetical protein Clopa_4668 [Clostridium pasteurianum BC1]
MKKIVVKTSTKKPAKKKNNDKYLICVGKNF